MSIPRIRKKKPITIGSEWLNEPDNIEDYYGFIYLITNLKTNKYYIGKKFFWNKTALASLKGKKRKRRILRESDWRAYWGSCNTLLADIEENGYDDYHREIIWLCKDKWECAYMEAKKQFMVDAIIDDDCYNGLIAIRLLGRKGYSLPDGK